MVNDGGYFVNIFKWWKRGGCQERKKKGESEGHNLKMKKRTIKRTAKNRGRKGVHY